MHFLRPTMSAFIPSRIKNKIGSLQREYFSRKMLHCNLIRSYSWCKSRLNQKYYNIINEDQLRACRKSDTLFIFGSGYSLNDLTPAEISHLEQHDTLGFNWFVYQNAVRVDFQIIREVSPSDLEKNIWQPKLLEYGSILEENPRYADTAFVVQGEFKAVNGNRLIGRRLIPQKRRIFLYRNFSRGRLALPSNSLAKGLVHGKGTLMECINLGYLLGWKKIVLMGIDLYDRRYFWLKPDETRSNDLIRGASHVDQHNTAYYVIQHICQWLPFLKKNDIQLYVYNPRSLLAEKLPVYKPPSEVIAESSKQSPVKFTGQWKTKISNAV